MIPILAHPELVSGSMVNSGMDPESPQGVCEGSISDFWQLLKPKVMSLVVFTGLIGMWVAPVPVHPFLGFVAILSLAIGAGAAGAINCWIDRDIDGHMARTATRPLPAGRINPPEALAFGIILSVLSVLMMALVAGWLPAGILAFANFFYTVIYSILLKRTTDQNIVIGGAAGAFPPMIGWVVATGSLDWQALWMFALIFFWTPPHFWALSLWTAKDYGHVGVPMLPVTRGETFTRKAIFWSSLPLLPLVLIPVFMGWLSIIFGMSGFLLTAIYVLSCWKTMREENGQFKTARASFGFSVLWLFAIFLGVLLDVAAF